MAKLSALFQYPVKSCAGLAVDHLTIGPRGPVGDREYMITDEHYVFLTQRKEQHGCTRMALITPTIGPGALELTFQIPYMVPHTGKSFLCTFPIRTSPEQVVLARVQKDLYEVIDQGDAVASWLYRFLDITCRLVRINETFYRPVDQIFSPEKAQTSLNDGFPVLIISDASLIDLNLRLAAQGKDPVSRENFRSCLWVGDCEAYEEDTWQQIRINGVVFDVVKPCARCSITQVDWQRGIYRDDNEPLITLSKYRRQTIPQTGKSGIMFGQNLVHRGLGPIYVGDEVEILKRK